MPMVPASSEAVPSSDVSTLPELATRVVSSSGGTHRAAVGRGVGAGGVVRESRRLRAHGLGDVDPRKPPRF
jgi:hypothetical protein